MPFDGFFLRMDAGVVDFTNQKSESWVKMEVRKIRHVQVNLGFGSAKYTLPLQCCDVVSTMAIASRPDGLNEQTIADMEAVEEKRLSQESEQHMVFDDDLDANENGDWLRGSGWPRWFRHKPLPIIITAAMMPAKGHPQDLFLGKWYGQDCISPVASERALQLLVAASHQVLRRCLETLAHTPRTLRYWLRSWTPAYSSYAFEAPTPATIQTYSRIWIGNLCYVFRVWLLAQALRESTIELCGLRLTDAQVSAMDHTWAMLTKQVTRDRKGSTEPLP